MPLDNLLFLINATGDEMCKILIVKFLLKGTNCDPNKKLKGSPISKIQITGLEPAVTLKMTDRSFKPKV